MGIILILHPDLIKKLNRRSSKFWSKPSFFSTSFSLMFLLNVPPTVCLGAYFNCVASLHSFTSDFAKWLGTNQVALTFLLAFALTLLSMMSTEIESEGMPHNWMLYHPNHFSCFVRKLRKFLPIIQQRFCDSSHHYYLFVLK